MGARQEQVGSQMTLWQESYYWETSPGPRHVQNSLESSATFSFISSLLLVEPSKKSAQMLNGVDLTHCERHGSALQNNSNRITQPVDEQKLVVEKGSMKGFAKLFSFNKHFPSFCVFVKSSFSPVSVFLKCYMLTFEVWQPPTDVEVVLYKHIGSVP